MGGIRCPFIFKRKKEMTINILDKIRVKWKIHKVCKYIRILHPLDQEEAKNMIAFCLRTTDDPKRKEMLFDMIFERCKKNVGKIYR